MYKSNKRTKKNYDGINWPVKELKNILPSMISEISQKNKKNPLTIQREWKNIIGEKLAPMTEVERFEDGKLIVKVKSSTLHSLLCQHEKQKLLTILQKKYSKETVRDIIFRVG
jgi:predicted nucleic acid-binding Zn ribbon protein